jgi:hypothetical protein
MEDTYGGIKVNSQPPQTDVAEQSSALPYLYIGKLTKGSVTPSVKNCERWDCINTGAVTITKFLDGQAGQTLYLLGDGFTTIANNSKLAPNTGAAKLLAANKLYMFQLRNGVWTEVQ